VSGADGRPGRWAPPLAWMGVVFVLSTSAFSFQGTLGIIDALLRVLPAEAAMSAPRVNAQARTCAHVVEYAVLALLWVRVLAPDRRRAVRAIVIAVAICAGWAAVDEAHQARDPFRRGKVTDVVLDTGGAVAGIGVWLITARRRTRARSPNGRARFP
jgi:VanZ family protein